MDGTGAAKPTNGTTKAKKVVKKPTKKVTKKGPGKVKKTAAVKKQEENEAAADEVDVTGGESTVEAEMAEAEEPEPEPEPEPTRRSRRKDKSSKKADEQDEQEQDDEEQKVRMIQGPMCIGDVGFIFWSVNITAHRYAKTNHPKHPKNLRNTMTLLDFCILTLAVDQKQANKQN